MTRIIALLTSVFVGLVLLLVGLIGTDAAQAQQTDIQILNHSIDTNFPTDVKFYVEATGPDDIVQVRVHLKKIGQTTRRSYLQVDFEPGTSVSGEAELLTSGNNYVPPGTRLTYHFEVTDEMGRVLLTDDQVFVYLDTRFEWLTVSEGIVTVYYNDPLVESRAKHVLETALKSMEITGPLLGINPDVPLHIVTYHNYRDMIGALPFRSQATRSQLITAGMAFDEERVLMVHSGDDSVTGTTAHEFVHLLVGDALGSAYSRAPGWLNEGLAEYGSRHGGDHEIENRTVRRAIDSGKVRPLWHLGTYSGTPQEILFAYGQGESVVTFMVQEYGAEKMAELMQAITRTLDIDSALMEVYGVDQHGIDSAWRQEIGLELLPNPGVEGQSRRQLLENIPDATVAPPGLVPSSSSQGATSAPPPAPVSAAPAEPQPAPTQSPADSTRRPTVAPTSPPAAVAVEPPAPQPRTDAPAERPATEAAPEAASGGCGPPSMQSGFVGEIALLMLLGMPLGLVMVRRGRGRRD